MLPLALFFFLKFALATFVVPYELFVIIHKVSYLKTCHGYFDRDCFKSVDSLSSMNTLTINSFSP